eukprot:5588713-Amphidinium_carterae.1
MRGYHRALGTFSLSKLKSMHRDVRSKRESIPCQAPVRAIKCLRVLHYLAGQHVCHAFEIAWWTWSACCWSSQAPPTLPPNAYAVS